MSLLAKVYGSVVQNFSVLAIFLLAQGPQFQELQLLVPMAGRLLLQLLVHLMLALYL
jgi:hypothetical protein